MKLRGRRTGSSMNDALLAAAPAIGGIAVGEAPVVYHGTGRSADVNVGRDADTADANVEIDGETADPNAEIDGGVEIGGCAGIDSEGSGPITDLISLSAEPAGTRSSTTDFCAGGAATVSVIGRDNCGGRAAATLTMASLKPSKPEKVRVIKECGDVGTYSQHFAREIESER